MHMAEMHMVEMHMAAMWAVSIPPIILKKQVGDIVEQNTRSITNQAL